MPQTMLDFGADPLALLVKAELGSARIPISEQCQSPVRESGSSTLHFIKSANEGDFILSRDSGESGFLLFARIDEKSRQFRIYHKRMTDSDYCENLPDFKFSWDVKGEHWSLVMCSDALVCRTCMYRSRNVSVFEEKPLILSVHQGMGQSEKGGQHWFYMDVEGISTEFGDRIVECRSCRSARTGIESSSPVNTRSSFSLSQNAMPAKRPELHLKSVVPSLGKNGDLSIRFKTKGRSVLPSARNMQIVSGGEIVFQFIKVSTNKFNIDFRCPLSPIQALCIALSTHYWK